jgi:uncharacterized protein (DUF488 family)
MGTFKGPDIVDEVTMSKPIIYTIGHSTHPIEYFLQLLRHYQVNCIVDVRSTPASRFNPQYNKKSLTASLKRSGIEYLHFGEAFGARQTDPLLLDDNGRVDFEKLRATEKFQNSISRLWKDTREGYTIALMCSEAAPLSCHRFVMISPALKNFEVLHILKDKTLAGQGELEDQLLNKFQKKIPGQMIFDKVLENADKLSIAYRMMNKAIAYVPEKPKGKS